MNWGRAKTILIVLFLALDVFLLVILMRTRLSSLQISEDTVIKTAHILQEHGIHITPEQFPVQRKANRNVILKNYFETPSQAAEQLLGRHFDTLLFDSEAHAYRYENQEATLCINGTTFTYEVKRQPSSLVREGTIEKETERILHLLESMGFAKETLAPISFSKTEKGYSLEVVPVYKKARVYGVVMHITADNEGILTISGNWFTPVATEQQENERLLDVTTVLVNLMYRPELQGIRVERLESGFLVHDDFLSSREIAAVPVYILTEKKGERFYVDARTGVQMQ